MSCQLKSVGTFGFISNKNGKIFKTGDWKSRAA